MPSPGRFSARLEEWKLIRSRTLRMPTWRAWVLVGGVLLALGGAAIRSVHPFLAVSAPVASDVMVVEGWVPGYALEAALTEFRRGGYRQIYSTGGPLEVGDPYLEFGSFAELGRVKLLRLGAPATAVQAVPAPKVRRERTFVSALALRAWLQRQGTHVTALNIVTTDTHSRRTRLLFAKAFGEGTRIGIIAIPDERFEGARWWRSSAGIRAVMEETLGYCYARGFVMFADDLIDLGRPGN